MAGPIILGNLTQMALGIIDAAMVGSIDYKQLAASSLVINLLSIPYVLCIGMTMAISPMVAIANGENNVRKASHFAWNGFWLSTLVSIVVAAALAFGQSIVFHMKQDPEVAQLAQPYLYVMAWSTIPMIMFLAIKQFTDALEFTRVAMILSLVSLPLNAFLNWLMIFGHWGFPRWELYGAGVATLISRVFILVALIIVVFKNPKFRRYIAVRRSEWYYKSKTWVELLKIGIPSSLQYGMEAGAFAVSGIMIGWLGATQQAAHQIALNCAATTFMVSLGLSQAGSIRVSNSYGKRDFKTLRLVGEITVVGGLIYGFVCAILFVLFRNQLPLAFNDNALVVQTAAHLMLFAALFQISDATQAIGVGLLRGMRDVRTPTILVAIAYWVLGIPAGYLLAFHWGMNATGIWIGFVVGLSFSSILLNIRFFRKTKHYSAQQLPTMAS